MEADPEMWGIENTTTPYNVPLCAKYRQSFAYESMKDRTPVILTKAIDHLTRNKGEIAFEYGEEVREELKVIIGRLSQLKNELQTNKPFTKLTYGSEADEWNKILEEKTVDGCTPTWFLTDWMYAECYFYRRMYEAFLESKTLHAYDPFQFLKNETLEHAFEPMKEVMAKYVLILIHYCSEEPQALENALIKLLKHSLWANRMDLSLSAGSAVHFPEGTDALKMVINWDEFIILDNVEEVWFILKKLRPKNPLIVFGDVVTAVLSWPARQSRSVKTLIGLMVLGSRRRSPVRSCRYGHHHRTTDIVMDNTGFEAMMDMCLADFLVTWYNVSQVRFRVKKMPWFVSDVMPTDFDIVINRLAQVDNKECKELAQRWKSFVNRGKWTVHADQFWTMPYTYNQMEAKDPELYSQLKQSQMVIFKGDLNYRKLVGDIHWDPTISFKKALQGFRPTTIVALRTNKAETVTGLLQKEVDYYLKKDPNGWLTTGKYGVIQHYSEIL